jgi:enoyl-CoA hydratase/carnithine racemase
VQVGRSRGIVTVTLSNPAKRNAVPADAWPDLEAAFGRWHGVATTAVVLTGEGDDFSSGADVTRAATDDVGHPLRAMRAISGAIDALHALPQTRNRTRRRRVRGRRAHHGIGVRHRRRQ